MFKCVKTMNIMIEIRIYVINVINLPIILTRVLAIAQNAHHMLIAQGITK